MKRRLCNESLLFPPIESRLETDVGAVETLDAELLQLLFDELWLRLRALILSLKLSLRPFIKSPRISSKPLSPPSPPMPPSPVIPPPFKLPWITSNPPLGGVVLIIMVCRRKVMEKRSMVWRARSNSSRRSSRSPMPSASRRRRDFRVVRLSVRVSRSRCRSRWTWWVGDSMAMLDARWSWVAMGVG